MKPGMSARVIRYGIQGEAGQAFVEVTLILPVLLAIIFAVAELGFMITDQIAFVHAAEDGARYGAAPGCLGVAACESDAATKQVNAALSGVNFCSPSSPTVSASVSGNPRQFITVTVTCSYQAQTPLGSVMTWIGGSFNATPTLSAKSIIPVTQ